MLSDLITEVVATLNFAVYKLHRTQHISLCGLLCTGQLYVAAGLTQGTDKCLDCTLLVLIIFICVKSSEEISRNITWIGSQPPFETCR
jgi:hypothetical protein